MSLASEDRKRIILELLELEGKVTTSDLVARLDVSKESVRRYLDELESEGQLRKVYGGAVKPQENRDEPPHLERMALHRDEKDSIGRYAAGLVQDGELLFLDEGTTPLCMIPYLQQRDLTILTHSFPAASLLMERINQGRFEGRVIFLGGELEARHARSTGSMTEEWLGRYYVDKAIISVDGLQAESGITSLDGGKASISRKAMAHADTTVVVADASKLDLRYPYKISDLSNIAHIVSNQAPPAEWGSALKRHHVRWHIAGK
ncbi:DeoR/GlpR family DNA-binding transcription regulator [Paenibacillus allorhizosphaerae]|uniref:HTH-type transcriptional regulator YdjF n=1 Tax=Paenibacillus allorhizosphaerae TaxID=2849866 RepID=A0ABM8VP31_9BACL|nr:DeoR/GlpR family DNA-binding transcription regulator [Paenibacillus allorhizosphaerae]CAG7652254.1 putative HTH-type transcriptional regulator YdjF [Paenibacillus allorhizosphaerae]